MQLKFFHCEELAIQLYPCGVCGTFNLTSNDPLDNQWTAFGDIVCSQECYEKAYDLMREKQHEISFYPLHPP